jgi:8-oxo-dGTP diphosphatase
MSQTFPPIHVVCAVILKEGLFLLAQRPPGKRLAGCWEFPGGKVEETETPEQALHREISEELGCRLQIIQPGPAIPWSYQWGEILLHSFLCELTEDSPMPENREHQALRWLSKNEIEYDGLAPADVPIIDWLLKDLPLAALQRTKQIDLIKNHNNH